MINANLKWLRTIFGISLKDLSKELRIKVSTLNSYEDSIIPRLDTLFVLLDWYKQAIETLTMEELYRSDLSQLYKDTVDVTFYEDIKTARGYKSKQKSIPNNLSANLLHLNKFEIFNKILELKDSGKIDSEELADILKTFRNGFDDESK